MTCSLALKYSENYKVVVYDKLDYNSSPRNLSAVHDRPNFTFVRGDVTDESALVKCLREHNIDTVLHLAALSHVDSSYTGPYAATASNFLGTHILLEAIKACGIRRFLHMSTDEVYGDVPPSPGRNDFVEGDSLAPTNPYSASKAGAEMLVIAYCKSYKIPSVIIRSNNVYGPGQYPESRYLSSFISCLFILP